MKTLHKSTDIYVIERLKSEPKYEISNYLFHCILAFNLFFSLVCQMIFNLNRYLHQDNRFHSLFKNKFVRFRDLLSKLVQWNWQSMDMMKRSFV